MDKKLSDVVHSRALFFVGSDAFPQTPGSTRLLFCLPRRRRCLCRQRHAFDRSLLWQGSRDAQFQNSIAEEGGHGVELSVVGHSDAANERPGWTLDAHVSASTEMRRPCSSERKNSCLYLRIHF